MDWPLAIVAVASLAAFVAALHVVLPYVRKRSDAETRLLALEAANVELRQSVAELVQMAGGAHALGRLPRLGAASR